jgi:transcription termination factor NusB
MVQEMQKQAQEVAQAEVSETKGQFNLEVQQTQGVQGVQETQKVAETTKASDVLRTAQANAVNATDQARLGVKPVDGASKKSGIARLLDGVAEGQNKLDDIIKLSLSGQKFDHQELLAIQASVYKFSQELELTSKVVEKATSGIKQTMQTQV